MLRFVTQDGPALSRRDWLGLSLLGLAAPRSSTAPGGDGFGKARSVLVVFTGGGMSQIDTLDPKPDAPVEVRGAFRTLPTRLPGVRFCEHLPRLAGLADRFTLLRSVSHDDLDHGSAVYLTLTGRFHPRKSSNPPPRPTDFPSLGAVLHKARPARGFPCSAVHLNGPLLVPEVVAAGQYGGFLGRAVEPITLGDPTRDTAGLEGLDAVEDLPPVRLDRRRSLLASLEAYSRRLEHDRPALDHSVVRRQAYDLLATPGGRALFDLSREPRSVRERYGLHRSGQACLLARRLVEAGLPMVTVFLSQSVRGQDKAPGHTDSYGWDTHNDIFEALGNHLLPRFDATFTALLTDLDQRGLLDQTLVLCAGEFGRAPLVALERNFAGTTPGRKHWAAVYSVLLAGAGVARGSVVGASDRRGAYPQSHPVGPGDLAATLFHALGIPPTTHYHDALDRPYAVAEGRPILSLYR